eukprot:gnl/Ergobibamus_cyprinoides/184.p2 GENE.gnl/Ergobibamus_cyprinoides/184~~gnl/Ergobibamus_cyprinoides/184.p2  ORF type:complete len:186 (+),score=33.98 gnl/Ergobibamus_cyprinoides/184:121-678(+)
MPSRKRLHQSFSYGVSSQVHMPSLSDTADRASFPFGTPYAQILDRYLAHPGGSAALPDGLEAMLRRDITIKQAPEQWNAAVQHSQSWALIVTMEKLVFRKVCDSLRRAGGHRFQPVPVVNIDTPDSAVAGGVAGNIVAKLVSCLAEATTKSKAPLVDVFEGPLCEFAQKLQPHIARSISFSLEFL